MYSASRLSDFIRLIGLETCKNRVISLLRFPVLEVTIVSIFVRLKNMASHFCSSLAAMICAGSKL